MRKIMMMISLGCLMGAGMTQAQNMPNDVWSDRAAIQAEMQALMSEPQFDEARARALIKEREELQLEQMRARHQMIQENGWGNNPRWNGNSNRGGMNQPMQANGGQRGMAQPMQGMRANQGKMGNNSRKGGWNQQGGANQGNWNRGNCYRNY